jgi:hypothetical protein
MILPRLATTFREDSGPGCEYRVSDRGNAGVTMKVWLAALLLAAFLLGAWVLVSTAWTRWELRRRYERLLDQD